MKKKAIITGIRGQDGAYLAKHLVKKGYYVIGTDRQRGDLNYWRLDALGILKDVEITQLDLQEFGNIIRVIKNHRPTEIYNLAAQSHIPSSYELPIASANVNALGVLKLLESIRIIDDRIKFFQASSSEIFGIPTQVPQSENTSFNPRNPYGISKLFAHHAVRNYRENYNLFCCSGILYNHESPLRSNSFVTKKITSSVVKIKFGLLKDLQIGNLESKRDWGYAPDYVEGMWRMLQRETAEDYILSTGELHTVRDFIEIAFRFVNIPIIWKGKGIEEVGINSNNGEVLVEVNSAFYRNDEQAILQGNCMKAKRELSWINKTSFEELIRTMVDFEIKKIKS
ncbi:GDP-mannose 4,6-dehydratase [Saprospiraceae bacterium]|nr:GDP-mannose 4,6-dehydratase [Saprospiraceae bacterium]